MKYTFITLIITLFFSLFASPLYAAKAEEKAKVMFLGTFHFTNPGLDAIKTQQMNVMTSDSQNYLASLSQRIAEKFTPTEVLVECPPTEQQQLNNNYQKYLAGNYALPVNETYQLGFRTAKLANAKKVTCYDERNIEWKAEALMKEMPITSPAIQSEFEIVIQDLTTQSATMHSQMTLQELLIANNQTESDQFNKSLYLLTNSVGAGDSFSGADAAASWWHRNFRMYANIQKVATQNSRVLVIGGRGHTAILKDLLAIDMQRESADILTFL